MTTVYPSNLPATISNPPHSTHSSLQQAEATATPQDTISHTLPLTLQHHTKISQYLTSFNSKELTDIGMKLGLTNITEDEIPDEMVYSWLKKNDDVMKTSGVPTWNSLITALKKCGYTWQAIDIWIQGKYVGQY